MSIQPKRLSRRWRSFARVWLLVVGVFYPIFLLAQNAPNQRKTVGAHVYEKLLSTQKEYEKTMANGDSLDVAEVCYRLGKRYGSIGDYETAQNYFIRSLRIRESRAPRGYSEAIGKVYLFMSHYQVQQGKYVDALQTVRKALANFKVVGSAHGLMSGNLSMAGVHALGFELSQKSPATYPHYSLDSSLYYFQEAEKIALVLKDPVDLANIYDCKGAFLLQTNTTKGLYYLKKADAIFSKEKSTYNMISTSLNLANGYLILRQPNDAKKWLEKAQCIIDTARQGDFHQQTKLFQTYTRLYEQTANWRQALASQEKYHELTIAALDADREGAITRLSVEYETQKKEAQLAWQRRMSKIAIGVCLLAILASVVFYRFFQRYKQISLLNAALVREQNHRVKNNFQEVINLLTLQASRLTNKDAQKAVAEGLLRMEAMALVHQRLYSNTDRLVEIDLASFIPDLVQGVLYSYSYERLQPVYQIEPTWLHADQALPLGLIINEVVTNACKYAFPRQTNPILRVTCRQQANTLRLEIMDHGPGFNAGEQYKSLGLKLIQAFTQRLDGQSSFGEKGNSFQLTFHVSQPA